MKAVYAGTGASAHKLNLLAQWVRETVAQCKNGKIDVIRFIEIDIPNIVPGFYVHVEDDDKMKGVRAFISDDHLGMVVSESIYESASNGCMFSMEIILHEIGHLFLHHQYSSLSLQSHAGSYAARIKDTGTANDAEWQATTFALCVLYPYSELRMCKNNEEIMLRFEVTRKQAERAKRHADRLNKRELSRVFDTEQRWLSQVFRSLPQNGKATTESHGPSEQLSLFKARQTINLS